MDKRTESILVGILLRCKEEGGVIEKVGGMRNRPHMDWLIEEGYIRTSRSPIHVFMESTYSEVMPTEKAYEWYRQREAEEEDGTEQAVREISNMLEKFEEKQEVVRRVGEAAAAIGKAWSGSSLGEHTKFYYEGLEPAPADAYWDTEWGMHDGYGFVSRMYGDWRRYSTDEVKEAIFRRSMTTEKEMAEHTEDMFRSLERAEGQLLTELEQAEGVVEEATRGRLLDETRDLKRRLTTGGEEARKIALAYRPSIPRDLENMGKGAVPAAHHEVLGNVEAAKRVHWAIEKAGETALTLLRATKRRKTTREGETMRSNKVFVGHGGESHAWRAVAEHLRGKGLEVEEFERTGPAGHQIKDRLEEMMDGAGWAVLVVTETETKEGMPSLNVIHEVGYAQGRLGWEYAIILMQEGCRLPSNLQGTVRIDFSGEKVHQTFSLLDRAMESRKKN